MLTWLLLSSAYAAPLPEVQLSWRRGVAVLDIIPPAGLHVAEEAPVDGWIAVNDRQIELHSDGLGVLEGLALTLPGRDEWSVRGELSLSLCEDDSTLCRLVDIAFEGAAEGSRGEADLWVRPAERVAHPDAPAASGLTPEEAFAQAEAEGKRVLLDFSAVWCPPCNMLAAEILHDPDEASALEPFVVVEINADTRESWPWKDRYSVGGYPTMIVAEPDGALVGRMLGYPGEEAVRDWLREAAGELEPLSELLGRLDAVPPEEAAEVALRLIAEEREDEAQQVLERAPEGRDAARARLSLDPTREDLMWLMENDPGGLEDWFFDGMSLLRDPDEELAAMARALLSGAAAEAEPEVAADLAYVAAGLAPEAERPMLYGLAASALRSALSGDIALDRGRYTWLASLYEDAGRPDLAQQLLSDAVEAYPHEFTFHYALAGLLLRQEALELALAHAMAAEALGYGDMRLRAARRQADVLVALDRAAEAKSLLRQTIDRAERPEEGVEVRTTRYIEWLEEHLAELEGAEED